MSTTKLNWEVQTLAVSREHIHGIKSGWYCAIFGVSFIPIHQYPQTGPTPTDGEIGAIVKMTQKGKITKIIRRVANVSKRKRLVY